MPEPISVGFEKLLRKPAYCQLSTLMADGSPHVTQVWVDTDCQYLLINTSDDRQKVENVRRDPRVAVNVADPENVWSVAMVRGRVVEVTTEDADRLIDELSRRYLDVDPYPLREPAEVRVMKILPEKINGVGLSEKDSSPTTCL